MCLASTAGPTTAKPTAGQTLLPSTDSLQGQRMRQAHQGGKLTSSQGRSPPRHMQANSGAWPFTFPHLWDAMSFLPQAGRHSGFQAHRGKWQEERGVEELSAQPRCWVTNHLQYILKTQRTSLVVSCWGLSSPWMSVGCRASPKRIRQAQKRCSEHPRPHRPLQEALAESFQHKPVCFDFLI